MMNEEITPTEEFNSQYTFWKLLSEYKIEIPIIQRDYAQGRVSAKAIRDELLESIYNALINDSSLDFDFVYGSSEECEEQQGKKQIKYHKLLPLDGQQRLTTFFLLHWYLAEKEKQMELARGILQNFSYTTRISSREFCEMLVEMDYTPTERQSVSDYIKNENRYFRIWDTDPTIKAMLTMLDDIHEKFFCCEPLFSKLISDDPALITFNYLPMEHYALTDDLYIKMNARGKALSVFENFKAKFIQHLKKVKLPYEHFEANIDSQWVELLWDYRSEDNTVDKQFMNLFCYCTEMIFLWEEPQKNCESPFRPNNIRQLVEYYDTEDKVELLYDLMDLWASKEEAKCYLEDILSEERVTGKVRLFEGRPDIFSDIILEGSSKVSLFNRILLFSIMNRLIILGKDTDRDKMLDYVRISRNLLIKNRSFSSSRCAYNNDFRFGRNGIPYTSFIANNLADSEDPYLTICGDCTEKTEGFNSEVYRQESVKANIIISKPELMRIIQSLEDLSIFRSSIFNILDYAVEYEDESLADNLETLFTEAHTDNILPTLISVGDYGIKVGSTYYGDRCFYGNKKDWYQILTYPGGKNYVKILTDFIKAYQDNESEYISNALNEIREENLKKISIDDWRYCIVKYPSTISYTKEITNDNLVFTFERHPRATILHRMNGKTLNALHVVPEYIEAAIQLKGKCSEFTAGHNSDDGGWVKIENMPYGSIGIELNDDGMPYIRWYENDNSEINSKIADVANEEYQKKDTTGLDRVERIVLMANTAIEVFTNARITK